MKILKRKQTKVASSENLRKLAIYPYQNLALKNIKSEVWEDLPDLDGAYEISNFGRVKSKRRFVQRFYNGGFWTKEKILKQRKSLQLVSEGKRKLFRLSVTISFEGKKHSCAVARMVYFLFVKNFDLDDRKIKVSMRDEDAFNITPKNLFLTSTDVYMKKAYELKRRKRESFGNKCKIISQYDLKGKWLQNYPSVSLAAQATNGSSGHILKSIRSSEGVASGYIWKFGKETSDLLKIPKRVHTKTASLKFHSTVVSSYNLRGVKMKEYRNVKAAAKSLGIQPNSIRKAILGDSISVKERFWKMGSGPEKISMLSVENRIRESKINIWQPVAQYSLKGDKIKSHNSITRAAAETGLHQMNISGALKSKGGHTAGGFLWVYGVGASKVKTSKAVKRKLQLQEYYEKPVSQYSMDGTRIAVYDSLKLAAKKMDIAPSFLVDALIGKALSYAGFYWQTGRGATKIKDMPLADAEMKRLKKISKPVVQYDLQGKKLKEFQSIEEASRKTKISRNEIRMVALGKYKATKESVWKFKS